MMREIRVDRYKEWAEELLPVAKDVLEGWQPEMASESQRDFFPSIVHSICISHVERLLAAVALVNAGLGNHAAPFVRIAYEENTWLHYLASIGDPALRNELLHRLSGMNKMQRVRTQRSFFGEHEARATGFLPAAHEELAPQIEMNLQQFEELAVKLNWPSLRQRGGRPGGLPKLAWLAEKRFVVKHPIHGFLAECSSQYVHFSAYQTMRGVKLGKDGRAEYGSSFQRGIDAGFAMGWMTDLLIDCFLQAKLWAAPTLDFEGERLCHWPMRMERIRNQLQAYGLPALIYAADLVKPE